MNIQHIFIILFGIFNLSVGILVLIKRPRSVTHQSFFTFTLGSFFWSLGFILLNSTHTFIFDKLTLFGALLGVIGLLMFAKYFPKNEIKKITPEDWMIVSPLIILITLLPYDLIIKNIEYINGVVSPVDGILFIPFAITIGIALLLSIYFLIKNYLKANPLEKHKLQYFIFTLVIYLILVLATDLILPLFHIYTWNSIGFLSLSLLVIGTGYTMLSRTLLDISFIIQKTLIYSFLLTFTSIVYALTLFIIQSLLHTSSPFFAGLVSVFITSFSFPYIDKVLKHLTSTWLYKQEYDPTTSLILLNKNIAEVLTLDEIVDVTTTTLKSILGSHQVLLIASHHTSSFHEEPFIHTKTIYLPIHSRNTFVGTLVIGPKQSGDSYSSSDLSFLEAFSYALAHRLRLASLVQELSQTSHHLKQELTTTEEHIRKTKQEQNHMIIDIAHNLQTPLTILKGEIQSLIDTKGNFNSRDLNKLDESVDRFSQFITRLMKAGNITKEEYHMEYLNMSSWTEEIIEYLTTIAESQDIILSATIEPHLFTLYDPKAYEELLINLVGNAMKYKKEEGIHKVSVSLHKQDDDIYLSVTDNGIGISPSLIPHLFNRWHQGDHTKQGSGLGLHIVKKIADAHHATITVTSEEGERTTFTIRFQEKKR